MGDGRYYTTEQFFNIIFFTILIIFIVISLMVCLYKSSKNNKSLIFTQLSLGLSIVCRFIEEIAYKKSTIEFFNIMSDIFLWIYIITYLILLTHLYAKKNLDKFSIVTTIFLFGLPVVLQLSGSESEKFIYILFNINFSVISTRLMPYRISSSIFGAVKDFILDYVFITDENGYIIYKNTRVMNSNIFNRTNIFDVENIQNIFSDEVTTRIAYDKSFIKYVGSREMKIYFQYNKKELLKDNQIVGYIITFIDITELINMLDELKIKQNQTTRANNKLTKYKDIVYEMEKEKEINNLLSEIANNQYKSMRKLKTNIDELSKNVDDDFDKNIVDIIQHAKDDLQDVRSAVTAYMNYYE
ncbi:hypothetical protein AN1V17_17010 [Vallitalea sediminicola]